MGYSSLCLFVICLWNRNRCEKDIELRIAPLRRRWVESGDTVAAGMLALDHDDIPEPRAVFLNAGEAILVVFCVVGTRLDENVASHGRDRVGM